MNPGELFHRAIAQRAYTIFETRGRRAGHEVSDWLQAEAEVLEGLITATLSRHAARDQELVRISHKIAAKLYRVKQREQMGCVITIQNLSRFEKQIEQMEMAFYFRWCRNIAPERVTDLSDIMTYSYLWVLGAYEIIRALAATTAHPDLQAAKDKFGRIRMPLAKLEASRKHKTIDYNFPYPAMMPGEFSIGWAINRDEVVTRDSLSSEMFTALMKYADQI
jgi:hypothetical protein